MSTVIRIMGGLGNQMFQYALVVALRKSGIRASVDYSDLILLGNQHQGYELNRAFGIKETIPCISVFKYRVLYHMLFSRFIQRNPLSLSNLDYDEFEANSHNYYPEITSGKYRYMAGYYQSEKYFTQAEKEIRSAFSFVYDSNTKNEQTKAEMLRRNSVSLHVRRGDYLDPVVYKDYGGICTPSYYKRAIEFIDQRVEDAHFYVFTDDFEYVRAADTFQGNRFSIVDWNSGKEGFRDMELMSCCKHNIIANSTFGWWGAWLNSNKEKIVVAPSRWCNNPDDFKDIIPDSWHKM